MKKTWLQLLVLLSGICLAAQESAADAAADGITPASLIARGGGLMYVLVALSVVAITLTVFYALTFRGSLLYPHDFLIEAQDAAEAGDLGALKSLCAENDCMAARILGASLEQCEEGRPVEYEFLRDGVEDEGARQAGLLQQRLQYLMDIAVIAPMVGLLGTIWGMMLAFQNFENNDIISKMAALTGGVSTAMYTTFGGLLVGIFAMVAHNILRGHLNKVIGELESACGSVLRRLSPKIRK